MARPGTRFEAASTNSAASSHHICGGNVPACFVLIRSIINLVIASTATGISTLTKRSAMPPETTAGAASHTRRSTGGTLRNAAKRLFQDVWLEEDTAYDIRYQVKPASQWPRTRVPEELP